MSSLKIVRTCSTIISENDQRRQRLQLQKNLCFTVTPFGGCLHFKIRNFGGITIMLIISFGLSLLFCGTKLWYWFSVKERLRCRRNWSHLYQIYLLKNYKILQVYSHQAKVFCFDVYQSLVWRIILEKILANHFEYISFAWCKQTFILQ